MPLVSRRRGGALAGRFRRRVSAAPEPGARRASPVGEQWSDRCPSPWDPPTPGESAAAAWCNICRWTGDAFEGVAHCEGATCPRCGSIGRDRFLLWCFARRTPPRRRKLRVLETSPRLGEDYRQAMGRWFDYRSSDYDGRAHRASLRLDLQAMDLPDASLDVVLSPHVLEHVPDTDRALGEIARVLAPKGRLYLQVPVLQGRTAAPEVPEFHGDDTPVHWRFGYDLTDRLRAHGLATTALVPASWVDLVRAGARSWPDPTYLEFDVASMLAGCVAADLTAVADLREASQIGAEPAYMFLTWEAIKAR
jgi:SAM-dependent methyltransferase